MIINDDILDDVLNPKEVIKDLKEALEEKPKHLPELQTELVTEAPKPKHHPDATFMPNWCRCTEQEDLSLCKGCQVLQKVNAHLKSKREAREAVLTTARDRKALREAELLSRRARRLLSKIEKSHK